jgi:hypothetical protein
MELNSGFDSDHYVQPYCRKALHTTRHHKLLPLMTLLFVFDPGVYLWQTEKNIIAATNLYSNISFTIIKTEINQNSC